jgi:hypothetical protein
MREKHGFSLGKRHSPVPQKKNCRRTALLITPIVRSDNQKNPFAVIVSNTPTRLYRLSAKDCSFFSGQSGFGLERNRPGCSFALRTGAQQSRLFLRASEQNLQSDLTAKFRVVSEVNLTHAARAKL